MLPVPRARPALRDTSIAVLVPEGDTMARATNDIREINLMFSPGVNLAVGSILFLMMLAVSLLVSSGIFTSIQSIYNSILRLSNNIIILLTIVLSRWLWQRKIV